MTSKKVFSLIKSKLKKLDDNRITEYAKDSLINERIKRIEIEKNFKIIANETLLSKVISDIYSGIGISSLSEFENYLSQNDVDIEKLKKKSRLKLHGMTNCKNLCKRDRN